MHVEYWSYWILKMHIEYWGYGILNNFWINLFFIFEICYSNPMEFAELRNAKFTEYEVKISTREETHLFIYFLF